MPGIGALGGVPMVGFLNYYGSEQGSSRVKIEDRLLQSLVLLILNLIRTMHARRGVQLSATGYTLGRRIVGIQARAVAAFL